MIPIGTLDRVTAIVGERGMGKSTLARLDAIDFQRKTGGYVIGHSPNGQIGEDERVEFHDELKKLQRGLKRHPEKMHFLAKGPAEPVLHFGDALSTAIRRSAHHRVWKRFRENRPAPQGLQAPPLLIVIDEGTSMKRHPSNEETEALERLLVNARHKHLGITWSIQAPTARQWVLMEQANRLRIFRYTHEYGVNSLRAGGIPKDVAYKLRELPRFHYFAMDKGGDDQGAYMRLPDPRM